MKKWIIIALSTAVIVVQFQNCEQVTPGSIKTQTIPDNSVSAPSLEAEVPEDFTMDNVTAVDFAFTGAADKPWTYRIELNTARIHYVDRERDQKNTLNICLTENEKVELGRILNSAQFCEGTRPHPDQICAQVFTPPHSRLVQGNIPGSFMELGATVSSCQQGPDLCGSAGLEIKEFFDTLQMSIAQSTDNRPCAR